MSNTTSINPFDDDSYQFCVLLNQTGHYSLWPEFAAIPTGWQMVLGLHSRQQCLDYIEAHWLSIQNGLDTVRTAASQSAAPANVPGSVL